MTRILALDQATRELGWSVFENGQLHSFGHKTFSQTDVQLRIFKASQWLDAMIEEYKPTKVVLEDIQLEYGDVTTYQKLAWLQGAILIKCQEKGVPYEMVHPTSWRAKCNFLTGKDKRRAAQKKIAQEWVLKTYGQQCTEDESDAICIGYAATIEDAFDWS